MSSSTWLAYSTLRTVDNAVSIVADSPDVLHSQCSSLASVATADNIYEIEDAFECEPNHRVTRSVEWSKLRQPHLLLAPISISPSQRLRTHSSMTVRWCAIPSSSNDNDDAAATTATAVEDATADAKWSRDALRSLPCRTVRITHSDTPVPFVNERTVYFLPRTYLCFPTSFSAETAAALTHIRDTHIAALLRSLEADTTLPLTPYLRFRLLWTLCRDQPASGTGVTAAIKRLPSPCPLVDSSSSPALESTTTAMQRTIASYGTGVLPQCPFLAKHDDAAAMTTELLSAVVHCVAVQQQRWNVDARRWTAAQYDTATFEAAVASSCTTLSNWIRHHFSGFNCAILHVRRAFRSGLDFRRDVLQWLQNSCEFEWTDVVFQHCLLHSLTNDSITTAYPRSLSQRLQWWRCLLQQLEDERVDEIDDALPTLVNALLQRKARKDAATAETKENEDEINYVTMEYTTAATDPAVTISTVAPSTVQTVTMRIDSGFSRTTGLSLWPGGLRMCEFVLSHASLFAGKRLLEIGAGNGLVSVILARAGVSMLLATDGDEKVVRNLSNVMRINGVAATALIDDDATPAACSETEQLLSAGIYTAKLDWLSPSRSHLLRRAAPQIIIACDTIYCPDLHISQADVLLEAMSHYRTARNCGALAATAVVDSALSFADEAVIEPFALFCQSNRNPETFQLYLDTFAKKGLDMSELDCTQLRSAFDYTATGLHLHRIEQSASSLEAIADPPLLHALTRSPRLSLRRRSLSADAS